MKDLNLVRRIAWSFHYTTGIEYDELFSLGSLAYAESLISYKKGKGTTSLSHSRNVITNRLNDFCKRERTRKQKTYFVLEDKSLDFLENLAIQFGMDDYLSEIEFTEDASSSFTTDMRVIIQIILSSPEDFVQLSPKIARGKIVDILRTYGWSWSRIWDNIRSMKSTLNEMEIGSILLYQEK